MAEDAVESAGAKAPAITISTRKRSPEVEAWNRMDRLSGGCRGAGRDYRPGAERKRAAGGQS